MSLRFLKFFAALALVLLAAPASAQELFTVAGVHVDATAASSAEALNLAIAQGRPRAWQILYRRLTREQDWPRQPALDGAALLRLARGYTIANERRSTTRYVADVTYIFNAEAVSRTLQGAGIAFTQAAPKRILIVPMAPTFSSGPWAQALSAPGLKDSVVPFTVAGAADAPGLGNLNFDNASWSDVAAAAARIKAGEAALVQVVYVNNKVTVNVRRIGLGEQPLKSSVEVPLLGTVGTTYPSAAQAAIRLIEDMWKTRAAVDFSQRGRLTLIANTSSLADWARLRTALGTVDNVTSVQVLTLDIGYAQMAISYQGGADQLRDALGAAGLSLVNRGGEWSLAMNASSP
jgi:hypothetical protein